MMSARRGSTKTRSSKDDESANCFKCDQLLDKDSQALQCNMCGSWYCLQCSKLSPVMYKAMTEENSDSCMYVCPPCLGALPTLKSINKTLTDIKQSTTERFDKLETRVDDVEVNMKSAVKEEASAMKTDLKTEIMQDLEKRLNEREDQSRRSDNLIFFSVPESNSDVANERVAHDRDIIARICEATGVVKPQLVSVVRLGKRDTTTARQPRPTKVRFVAKSDRRSVLLNRKKLSDGDEILNKISISKDLTPEQRRIYKETKEAAKKEFEERVKQGETGIELRGIRIINSSKSKTSEVASPAPAPFSK